MTLLRFPRLLCQFAFALGTAAALPAGAVTQVLYDSGLGTLPGSQLWLKEGMFGAIETLTPQGVVVTPFPFAVNDVYGGYSNYTAIEVPPPELVRTDTMVNGSLLPLDRNAGYSLTLGFQVISESHTGSADRAGFSITLIGSDKTGIAIGFQNDRIFAHNGDATLTAGESNVNSALVGRAFASSSRWDISVSGSTYVLSQGGDQVLTGSLRDYANGGYNGPGNSAYKTANFLFFGDNTSSAKASFLVDYAAVTAVPEPSAYMMLIAGLSLVGAVAFRRRRALATVR